MEFLIRTEPVDLILAGASTALFEKSFKVSVDLSPQWGAADAESKVPSGENTELKRSPFKA